MNESKIKYEEKLALNKFLRGFKPPKNEDTAKKTTKDSSKIVSHSVSSGKRYWSECANDT